MLVWVVWACRLHMWGFGADLLCPSSVPVGGSRIIRLGMCPRGFCAEWFGSAGTALTNCAFGRRWDLHPLGSAQWWQGVLSMDSSLHLSEYVQIWDYLRQMSWRRRKNIIIEEYFFVRKYKPHCQHIRVCTGWTLWATMHATFVCQCFQIVNKPQVQSSVTWTVVNMKIEAKLQLPNILFFIFNYNFSRNQNHQQVWLIFSVIFNRLFNTFLTLWFAVICWWLYSWNC